MAHVVGETLGRRTPCFLADFVWVVSTLDVEDGGAICPTTTQEYPINPCGHPSTKNIKFVKLLFFYIYKMRKYKTIYSLKTRFQVLLSRD